MNERVVSPSDVIPLIVNLAKKRHEHFGIICLDSGKNVLTKKILFIGDEFHALINKRMIFWEACSKKASAIVLFHNHPSCKYFEPPNYGVCAICKIDCTYTSCYGNKDKCKHTKKEENKNTCSSVL